MSEHVIDVKRQGDWYRVTGVSDGKRVGVDVPAPTVEGKSREEAFKTFEKGLKQVRDYA